MSSSTFEARLARMAGEAPTHRPSVAQAPQVDEPSPRSGIGLLNLIVMLPIAMTLGAAAVMLGGIVQVAFIDGGMTPATPIPPQLGFVGFGIAFVLSFLIDKLLGGGIMAPIAVTAGFITMICGEGHLAQMYPEIWAQIYQAKYLTPVMEMLTDFGGIVI